jgi:cytoskeletal protein RodZ
MSKAGINYGMGLADWKEAPECSMRDGIQHNTPASLPQINIFPLVSSPSFNGIQLNSIDTRPTHSNRKSIAMADTTTAAPAVETPTEAVAPEGQAVRPTAETAAPEGQAVQPTAETAAPEGQAAQPTSELSL